MQILEERAELLRRVAAQWSGKGQFGLANLEEKAQACDMHAATIRQVFEKLPRE